ncbi:MAG: restriction endonuclease subunit S [Deltaproteobacteria bacterium]|nr:restriction endonuclease subunit S [Deltaproteobacteria bacterium]
MEGPCIIVGRKGSAGKINFIKQNCYPIDTTFYVKFNKEKILIKYLYYLLRELDLERFTRRKGVGAPGLNRNDVYNERINIHPISKQEKIVSEIESFEAKLIDLESYLSNSNNEKEEILKKYLGISSLLF